MNVAGNILEGVHPAVRVVCFIVFSFFLALGDVSHVAAAILLLIYLYTLSGLVSLSAAWFMLRRMRWFFLSVFVIYLWMTPGQALLGSAWWMPTLEGVILGGQRLLALALLIMAVHWLLFVTSRQQLVSALYWLAGPLAWFGFPRERLAVRLALILGLVAEVQHLVSKEVDQVKLAERNINEYAVAASGLVEKVVAQAEAEPCQTIEVDVDVSPSAIQWLWPVGLAVLMSAVGAW